MKTFLKIELALNVAGLGLILLGGLGAAGRYDDVVVWSGVALTVLGTILIAYMVLKRLKP